METLFLKNRIIIIFFLIFTVISIFPNSAIITGIEYRGNKLYGQEEMNLFISSKIGDIFNSETLQKDINTIYRTGFFSDVGADTQSFSGGIKIIFTLVENEKVSKINFAGNNIFSGELLSMIMSLTPDSIFNFNTLKNDISDIEKFYASRGFIKARVVDIEVRENGRIINITIDEPVIAEIIVSGNKTTNESYILRLIGLTKGKYFNNNEMVSGLNNLRNTGIFSEISFELEVIDIGLEKSGVVVKIDVNEKKTGELAFGLNYGTFNGFVFFMNVDKKNFRGGGETLGFELKTGKVSEYVFKYEQPHFKAGEGNIQFGLYSFNTTRDKFREDGVKLYSYDEEKQGFTLGYELNNEKNTKGWIYKNEKIKGEAFFAGGGKYEERKDWVEYITSFYSDDSKINLKVGMTGVGFLKGNREYYYYDIDYINSNSFSDKKLNFRIKTEGITIGQDKLAEYEKIKFGGANSLRGYKSEHFTTNSYYVINLEYRLNLKEKLWYVLFSDLGYVNDSFKKTIGFGLAFDTPAGIIRVDYGRPFGDKLNESGRIYLGTGFMF